jgi:pantoate--beta-alanine ligase
MKKVIDKQSEAKIDYMKIVDTKNLKDIQKISGKTLIAAAIWIGKTRLIDNIILN